MNDSVPAHILEQRRYDGATKQHDYVRSLAAENFKVTITAAASALRVLLTVNAGGALALLGFIGAIAGKEKRVFDSASAFACPISLFGAGIILAVFATCCMYFAQGAFSYHVSAQKLTLDHPFISSTPASRRWKYIGTCFQVGSILGALGSFLVFIVGIYECRSLILLARL